MDRQALALMGHQHGLVTHSQLVASGVRPEEIARLVRGGEWVRVRKGVYATGALWDELDEFRGRPILRIRAAALRLPPRIAFSHDSAALLRGLGVPDSRRCLVHVTRPGPVGSRGASGIKQHLAPVAVGDEEWVAGLPALSLARTAIDMVREHGLDGGLPAVDQALGRGVSMASLRATQLSMRSWPGSRAIHLALQFADPGSESWGESRARLLVWELGIGEPETQFGLTAGGRTAYADFRVGRHLFEYDGRQKYDDPRVLWDEKRRQDFLTGFKLGMSRITHGDLGPGRESARRRLLREYLATCDRFGVDISDLASYRIRRRPTTPL